MKQYSIFLQACTTERCYMIRRVYFVSSMIMNGVVHLNVSLWSLVKPTNIIIGIFDHRKHDSLKVCILTLDSLWDMTVPFLQIWSIQATECYIMHTAHFGIFIYLQYGHILKLGDPTISIRCTLQIADIFRMMVSNEPQTNTRPSVCEI
jgi:hypothetical protein